MFGPYVHATQYLHIQTENRAAAQIVPTAQLSTSNSSGIEFPMISASHF